MSQTALLVELDRWSISFWAVTGNEEVRPVVHGEGNNMPLRFHTGQGGIVMGHAVARTLPAGSNHRVVTDLFDLLRNGENVPVRGSQQPASILLFETVERYAEAFVREHLRGAGGLDAQRRTLRLRFAFAPDLEERDRGLVLDLFKTQGYSDVERVDLGQAMSDAARRYLKLRDEECIVWLSGSADDLYLVLLTKAGPSVSVRLAGLGQDPRLAPLVEELIKEAEETLRLGLDKDDELPGLTVVARAMLAKGGKRLTATIALADGTRFEASVAEATLIERTKFSDTFKRITDAVDASLGRVGLDPAHTTCVLSGATIANSYYEGRLAQNFRSVHSRKEELAKQLLEALAGQTRPPNPDQPYLDAIAQADAFFTGKDWANARTRYQEAARIKPQEDYPDRRMAECEVEQYREAIAQADVLFEKNDWDSSKAHYEEAARIKPQEGHSRDRILKCEEKIIEREKGQVSGRLIAEAEKLFAQAKAIEPSAKSTARDPWVQASRAWQAARDANHKALTNGSSDAAAMANVQVRHQECQERMANATARANELTARYNEAVKQGDAAFTAWDFKRAIRQYETAKAIDPREQYPYTKLAEVKVWVDIVAKGPKKWTTTFLALFLGGIGAHRFYLDQIGLGILNMLFAWTGIPTLISFFKGLNWMFMREAVFNRTVNKGVERKNRGLLVMVGLLAAFTIGTWWFITKTWSPNVQEIVDRQWRITAPGETWIAFDERNRVESVCELVFDKPFAQWRVTSPDQVRIEAALNVKPLSAAGIGQQRYSAISNVSLIQGHALSGPVSFCVDGGGGCATVIFTSEKEIMLTLPSANGLLSLRAVPAADHQRFSDQEEYRRTPALREVDALLKGGGELRLGVFKAYTCEEGRCWAEFDEEVNGQEVRNRYLTNTPVLGNVRLGRSGSSTNGDRTHRNSVGRKFLFATQYTDPTGGQGGSVMTGIIPFSSKMNSDGLDRRLRRTMRSTTREDRAMDQTGPGAPPTESAPESSAPVESNDIVLDVSSVEVRPQFPAGNEALYRYLYDKVTATGLKHPGQGDGVVNVQFVILEDGTVTDAVVVKSIGELHDEAAKHIVMSMPQWNPATVEARAVKCRFVIPLRFGA